ncbi:MAG TPA: rhomboid family intramembrane serine protease [Acidimicrobiia bacterium]
MIPIRDDNPTARRAIVTILLIAVNIAIYFGVQYPKHGDANAEALFDYRWAGVPCEVRTGKPLVLVPDGTVTSPTACAVPASGIAEPQRAFPNKNVWLAVAFSMFLHGSILHVLGNMLFLWIFANNVEDRLGRFWFLVLYLVGGAVASAVHILGNLDSTTPFLGASGAIAVVMGAYIVWFPRARVLTLIPIVLVFFPVRLPAIVVLGLWFVLQIFTQSSSGIATLAHIGGFVFGMLVAFVLARAAGFRRHARSPRLDY